MSIFDKLLIPYVSKLSNVNSCVGNVSNVTPFQYLNWLSIWNKYLSNKLDGMNGGYNILSISDTGGYPTSISRMDVALNGTPYILPFGYNTPPDQPPLTFPNKLI